MHFFQKTNKIISKYELEIAKIGLASIIVLVFIGAVFRTIKIPLAWTTEVSQLIFGWVIFLGADVAFMQKRHVGVEIIESRLSPKKRVYLEILWNILIAAFLGLCIYYGFILYSKSILRRFNTIPLSYSWLTLSVPVGAFLMFRTNMILCMESFNKLRRKGGE